MGNVSVIQRLCITFPKQSDLDLFGGLLETSLQCFLLSFLLAFCGIVFSPRLLSFLRELALWIYTGILWPHSPSRLLKQMLYTYSFHVKKQSCVKKISIFKYVQKKLEMTDFSFDPSSFTHRKYWISNIFIITICKPEIIVALNFTFPRCFSQLQLSESPFGETNEHSLFWIYRSLNPSCAMSQFIEQLSGNVPGLSLHSRQSPTMPFTHVHSVSWWD